MIAVDTNILVYAHRRDSPFHDAARTRLTALAEGPAVWSIAWPSIHEFFAIVTHPRIYSPPSPIAAALDQVEAWLESPTVILLSEADGYWPTLRRLTSAARISGPRVHDARIAALCLQSGVRTLWSADRDFSRFSDLTVINPLSA